MPEKILGVLVSGRGSNLVAIINAIEAGKLDARIGVVLSDNPEAAALLRATASGIPAKCVNRQAYQTKEAFEQAMLAILAEHKVELVVLAGFMRLLSSHFINKFPRRIMNIHPSLLPSFPGANAQKQALYYGVKVSGCTVHFVDEGMDTGPIILQKCVPVLKTDTTGTSMASPCVKFNTDKNFKEGIHMKKSKGLKIIHLICAWVLVIILITVTVVVTAATDGTPNLDLAALIVAFASFVERGGRNTVESGCFEGTGNTATGRYAAYVQ